MLTPVNLPSITRRAVRASCCSNQRSCTRLQNRLLSKQHQRTSYADTLFLPKTTFPLKQKDPSTAELRYRERTTQKLYRLQANRRGPDFLLHDGPPYANGHLHMGHALNKILKDIINRSCVIRGKVVNYVPGWDCHGLPIETKTLKDLGVSHSDMSPQALRAAARVTANNAIDIQKEEFQHLGIMADWDGAIYTTMNPRYQIRQLNMFRKMVEKGYITHHKRPVYYSPSSRTALAESELVYKDNHRSRSVYVGFPVAVKSDRLQSVFDGKLKLAIWTTTPWTLPANAGVNVGEHMDYLIVESRFGNLVLAKDRMEALEDTLGPLKVHTELKGHDIVGTTYTTLFHQGKGEAPMVFPSEHVTAESGTGLVHSAPAHGYEDYIAFAKAGLLPEVLRCPVDDRGQFTQDVVTWAPEASRLVGKDVLKEGFDAVVEMLAADGSLLAEKWYEHRYPCDWKTKEPIIVRATPQWFADVDLVKPQALKALKDIQFFPPQSENRLRAFVLSRSEWCISRQRSWGVPIPALYEGETPVIDTQTIEHIIAVLEAKGVDHWWEGPTEDFVPPHLVGKALRKGTDTLDVWFDSGSSWTMLDRTADVYLEGSDQHRGWFQSSLLTKLGVSGEAPYRNVITHGFVVDEEGQKMSKSSGNGISPIEVIRGTHGKPGSGADALRIWAASVDYSGDVSFGPSALAHASETLRKLRSSLRFLLANSSGRSRQVEVETPITEQAILDQLKNLEDLAWDSYDNFNFSKVLTSVTTFASSTLSSFYFDAVKDTLYCDAADNPRRQAVVATLAQVFQSLLRIIAPIAPHLAEELYEHSGGDGSFFLTQWSPLKKGSTTHDLSAVQSVRAAINQVVEKTMEVKTAAECEVCLTGNGAAQLARFGEALPSLLGTADVSLEEFSALLGRTTVELDIGTIKLGLVRSSRHKCPRCRRHASAEQNHLCGRCETVIGDRS